MNRITPPTLSLNTSIYLSRPKRHDDIPENTHVASPAFDSQQQVNDKELTSIIHQISEDIKGKEVNKMDARLWVAQYLFGDGGSDNSLITRLNDVTNPTSLNYNENTSKGITLLETVYWAVSQGVEDIEKIEKGVNYKLNLEKILHTSTGEFRDIKSRRDLVEEIVRGENPQSLYKPIYEAPPASATGDGMGRRLDYDEFVARETESALDSKIYDTRYYEQFIDFSEKNKNQLSSLRAELVRQESQLSLKDFTSNVEGVYKIKVNWGYAAPDIFPGMKQKPITIINESKDAFVFKAADGQHYAAFQDENSRGAVRKISGRAYMSVIVPNSDTTEFIKTIYPSSTGRNSIEKIKIDGKTMADVVEKQQWHEIENYLEAFKEQNYSPTTWQSIAKYTIPFYDTIHNAIYDKNPPKADSISIFFDSVDVTLTLISAGIPITKGASAALKALKTMGEGMSRIEKISNVVKILAKPTGKAGIELLDGVLPAKTIKDLTQEIAKGGGKTISDLIQEVRSSVKPYNSAVKTLPAIALPPTKSDLIPLDSFDNLSLGQKSEGAYTVINNDQTPLVTKSGHTVRFGLIDGSNNYLAISGRNIHKVIQNEGGELILGGTLTKRTNNEGLVEFHSANLLGGQPPSKKPRLTLDSNHNVSYKGEGTYQHASKQNYKLSNHFANHEAEHSIGIDVLVNPYQYAQKKNLTSTDRYPDNTPFLALGSAGKPTKYSRAEYPKLENAAPAYQEFKPLHRNHIGTGVGNPISEQRGVEGIVIPTTSRPNIKKEQKNFDTGYYPNRYRAEQRSSIERGNIGEAIALNQLAYANSPVFRFFYRSEALQSNNSWVKLEEGSQSWINKAIELYLNKDLKAIGIHLNHPQKIIAEDMDKVRRNINESYYLQTKLPEVHWVDYPLNATSPGTIRATRLTDEHRIEMIRAREAAISGEVPSVYDVLKTTEDYNIMKGDGTAFNLQDIYNIMPPTDTDKVKKAYYDLIAEGNPNPTPPDINTYLKNQNIKTSKLDITQNQTMEVDIDISTISEVLKSIK